jgi:hypothetical protein
MKAGFRSVSFCAVVDGEVAWAVGPLPIGLSFVDGATIDLHGDVATDAAWFTFGVFYSHKVVSERYPQISAAAKAKLRAVARYVKEHMDGGDMSGNPVYVGRVQVLDTEQGRMCAMRAPDHEAWCLKELVRIAAARAAKCSE